MSVRFQEEQVRTTTTGNPNAPQGFRNRDETTAHRIGEALTGGESQKGYLAVSWKHQHHRRCHMLIASHRPTSNNSSPTHCELRCSHLALSQLCKNSSPRGLLMIEASMDTTSPRASPKWQRMVPSSQLQWVISSLASSNGSSRTAPLSVRRSYRSLSPT